MSFPPKYAVTADAIIVEEIDGRRCVALIRRKNPPFQGMHALPGGFVEPDETVEAACIREAREETSLDVEIERLVGIYSDPGRDPRGRTITGAYLCRKVGGSLKAMDDAANVEWVPVDLLDGIELAFDHGKILADAGLMKSR